MMNLESGKIEPELKGKNTIDLETGKVIPRLLQDEMEESYLDYAMSVIVARALPDVRDGLKPVQRRILYSMLNLGLNSSAKFQKSAKIVGETMGNYHPHGDAAIYETLVNMAQDFSQRYPLIWPQGNFGSMDGDRAAAARYTEAKMSKIAEEMVFDIDKETVDFRPNYDNTKEEPVVLPSKIPNLLLNGALGIAVGMATNIPPHNISEVMSALIALVDNPDLTIEDIVENYIKGPDFPTGGVIYDKNSIIDAYKKGSGPIVVRGVAKIEESEKGKQSIVITEIPYRQNKSDLVVKIADLAKEKIIKGISDIRDESSREGVRVVIELSKGAQADKILNQIFHLTPLQQNFNLNLIALEDGIKPKRFNLKEVLESFIRHRRSVTVRKLNFELKEERKKVHILEGLKVALDNIDEVINLIRGSKDKDEAKFGLMEKFQLTEIQADAILEMKLARLANLERQKILDELEERLKNIRWIEEVLSSEEKIMNEVKKEFSETKEKYSSERLTKVVPYPVGEFRPEDFVEAKSTLIFLTKSGYIKRMYSESYKLQNRGGKGVVGMSTKENDRLVSVVEASTHDFLLFFTNQGRVFSYPAYEFPEGTKMAKGQPIVNFLSLNSNEKVSVVYNQSKLEKYLFFVTELGVVKKTNSSEFKNIRSNGLRAVNFKDEKDSLVKVFSTDGNCEIILTTKFGQSIRFSEKDVRPMGRMASGVRGIKLRLGDRVVSAEKVSKDQKGFLFTLTEMGIGKKTEISEFNVQKRGGVGVKVARISKKTGNLSVVKIIPEDHKDLELLVISESAQVIRIKAESIPKLSRVAQGVFLMRVKDNDKVTDCEIV